MADVTYRKLIGTLLYLATQKRPDISFAVAILALHMIKPHSIHWGAAKRVLRYLRWTMDYALHLCLIDLPLSAYADADWAGGTDSFSVTGDLIYLGKAPVYWRSCKQSCAALSSTEAEYVSLSAVARDVHWLRFLFAELGMAQEGATQLYEDSTGPIAWANEIFQTITAKSISSFACIMCENSSTGMRSTYLTFLRPTNVRTY